MPFIFFSDRDIKHHEDTGHGFCPICECCIGCDCCVCGKEDSDDEETYEYVRPTPDNLDELYTEEEQMKILEVLKAKFQEEKWFQEAEAKAEEEEDYEAIWKADTDDFTCENCCDDDGCHTRIHYTVGNAHNWKKLLLCEKCKLEGVSDTRPEDEDKDKVEEEEVTTTTTTTEIFKGSLPELLKAAYPTNPFTWTYLTKQELRQKVPHLCPPRTEEESEDKDKVEEECESDDSWEPECCKCGTTYDQKGMGGVEHREDLCEWMCGRCYEYATRKEEC